MMMWYSVEQLALVPLPPISTTTKAASAAVAVIAKRAIAVTATAARRVNGVRFILCVYPFLRPCDPW